MDAPLLPEPAPVSVLRPMTKDDVADVFGVTGRTIENWIEQEGLPVPVTIGNRVYWHPHVFYAWLDKRLRTADSEATTPRPLAKPKGNAAKSEALDRLKVSKQRRLDSFGGK